MAVIITEYYKSKNKEHQGIFLQNGTHTIRTVTTVHIHKHSIICQTIKAHNNHNKQVSPCCFDLAANNVSSSDCVVTCYGN